MPLIKGKSKKAFESNLKTELEAGKPKDQSLAIAYSVKRKAAAKKKMAHGGEVEKSDLEMVKDMSKSRMSSMDSAKSEPRPMPQELDKDASMVKRNKHFSLQPKKDILPHSEVFKVKKASIASDEQEDREELAKYNTAKGTDPVMLAEGGMVGPDEENPHSHDDQETEADMLRRHADELSSLKRHKSIADAILNKHMYAEGGEVDIEENEEEQPMILGRLNKEALDHEYGDDLDSMHQPEDSNLMSDDISHDEHDMISKIRAKIKSKKMR